MAFTDKTETPDIVERWPYQFQHIANGDPLYDWLTPFATEYRQIDVFLDELYEQRFLATATQEELGKLASETGVTKRDGETQEEFRLRAEINRVVSASDGTGRDIRAIFNIAFEDRDLTDIQVEHDPGHPVTRFTMPQDFIDDIPLTRTGFQSELETAFPAGYGVEVLTDDNWLLGQSGSAGVGNGGLI